MKTAIIADVHGNYPAFTAVLEDAAKNGVKAYIFAGDYIFDLPYPNEVVNHIRNLKHTYIVKGNKEGYLKNLMAEDQSTWNIDQIGAIHQTYRELTPENTAYLNALPEARLVPLPYHGAVYVTHSIKTLENGTSPVTSSTSFHAAMKQNPFTHDQFLQQSQAYLNDPSTRAAIADVDASVIVFGHSHLQWHGRCEGKLVINPGACGTPLDHITQVAYTILTDTANGLTIEERRVPYDIENTISHVKTTQIYKKGVIWCEIVFIAMRQGKDISREFFGLARKLAAEKNETGLYFSNATWRQAAELYFGKKHVETML